LSASVTPVEIGPSVDMAAGRRHGGGRFREPSDARGIGGG